MRLYVEWIKEQKLNDRKWWVLGKGPTFALHESLIQEGDGVLGLNDVSLKLAVDIAHAVDADAVARLTAGNYEWLAVPYYLHVNNLPASDRPLIHYLQPSCPEKDEPTAKVIRCASTAKRLLTYRSSLCGRIKHPAGIGNPFTTVNFSSEPAVELLLRAGVREIGLLGVDGGTSYHEAFAELTPLTNGVVTFDVQFQVIARLAKKYKANITHPNRGRL